MRSGSSTARECPLLSDPGFAALRRFIVADTGLHYYEDRPADLAARLWSRMLARGIRDATAYLSLLRGPEEEAQQERSGLIDDIAIGETFFFRFAEQFQALQDSILPALLQSGGVTRTLNIWSAGCANGAEAYSLSILLKRACTDLVHGWDVSILATDLNPGAIERARRGVYTAWSLRTLDARTRQECFTSFPDGRFRLKDRYREGVTFRVHNLLHDEPPTPIVAGGFDLVFCRNVLIYFEEQAIEQTLRRLTKSLRPGGWLFLGHAETAMVRGGSAAGLYTVAFPGIHLHRRGKDAGGLVVPPLLPQTGLPAVPFPNVVSTSDEEALSDAPPFVLPLLPEPSPEIPALRTATPRRTADETRSMIRRLLDIGDSRSAIDHLEPLLTGVANRGSDLPASNSLRHDPVLHYYHALALEEQECLPEAEAALRKALYLDRSFLLAHYHLALVAEAQGYIPLAVRSLDTVLKLLEETGRAAPLASRIETLREIGDVSPAELRDIAQFRRSRLPKEEHIGRHG